MQKVVNRNIKDETLKHVPYTYNNQPISQVSPQKLQCKMWLHKYRKQWKTGSYTWTFLYIVGASDSTSQDWTKTPNSIGLETHSSEGLAPCWVVEKVEPQSEEIFWGGLWPSAICREAFYYPCCAVWLQSHKENGWEWLIYIGVCAILISEKFPNSVLQLLQEALSMEQ